MRAIPFVVLASVVVAVLFASPAPASEALRFDCAVNGQIVKTIHVNFRSPKSQDAFLNFLDEVDMTYGAEAVITASESSASVADEASQSAVHLAIVLRCAACRDCMAVLHKKYRIPDSMADFVTDLKSCIAMDGIKTEISVVRVE